MKTRIEVLSRAHAMRAHVQLDTRELVEMFHELVLQLDAADRQISELEKREPSVPVSKLKHSGRWNVERTADGVRICTGDHDKALGCVWEYFFSPTNTGEAETPKEEGEGAEQAAHRTTPPADSTTE